MTSLARGRSGESDRLPGTNRLGSRSRDVERLLAAPRVPLGTWPTPIEALSDSGGVVRLVKRDDLSGLGRGGAKARKIEHLVGHLSARGYDELVTVAGNITNLAFDLLPVLDGCGIRPTVFIADDPPTVLADREALFLGIRDRVTLLGPSRREALRAAVGAWIAGQATGRRPFLLLPGASHPACVVGNACGYLEMAHQLEVEDRPLPRTVYVSAATGTTVAGFLLAEHALRRPGRAPVEIVGVQVYPGRIRARVMAMIRWTERAFGLEGRVPMKEIEIVTGALHGGFGRYPELLAARCLRAEADLGFALDPIFGGKTWSVMIADPRTEPRRPALFWHCGWTPEWETLGRREPR